MRKMIAILGILIIASLVLATCGGGVSSSGGTSPQQPDNTATDLHEYCSGEGDIQKFIERMFDSKCW